MPPIEKTEAGTTSLASLHEPNGRICASALTSLGKFYYDGHLVGHRDRLRFFHFYYSDAHASMFFIAPREEARFFLKDEGSGVVIS